MRFAGAGTLCYGSAMTSARMPADTLTTLYHRAFAEFGVLALWNARPVADPDPAHALAVARALRTDGDMPARRLAEALEAAARAAS